MALRYDPPSGYTQVIPPGTAGFRKHAAQLFSFTRTEVVRDKSRCNQTSSEHCVCRAIDFFTTDLKKGRRIFEWCVANAEGYGIQSVIFNRRVWGFGTWFERHYSGVSPHTDHVHVGLNLKGAGSFIQEDDMAQVPQEEWEQVRADVADIKKALYIGQAPGSGSPPIELDDYVRARFKEVFADLKEIKERLNAP